MKITTGGESHGKGLYAILEGIPAGLPICLTAINAALARRQSGYGRGARQTVEHDRAEILTGVRNGVTLGSPIALAVSNLDHANWEDVMSPEACDTSKQRITAVRPGHADLPAMQKFGFTDARDAERASARETAVRVAAGEICRQVLSALGVEVASYTVSVGSVSDEKQHSFDEIAGRGSALGMLDKTAEENAVREIDACAAAGDTLGGTVELRVRGLKAGFGSCMTYGERLNARLCGALMSIQAAKGVEVGLGFASSSLRGSAVHDEIFYDPARGYYRNTNRAGGIEGGMSNGEEIVLRLAMKPLPTLARGLRTVDADTLSPATAAAERGDVCAIVAFGTVAESVLCGELCAVVLERLGGDTVRELSRRYGELP